MKLIEKVLEWLFGKKEVKAKYTTKRTWTTAEERTEIIERYNLGISVKNIAKAMNRGVSTVYTVIRKSKG